MESSRSKKSSSRGSYEESSADVRGYMAAIRRSRGLIIAIVILVTAIVLVLSLILPKSYTAVSRIVLQVDSTSLTPPDSELIQRRLATILILLDSPELQQKVADEIPGETQTSIEDKTDFTVDADANIVNVGASDREARRAADISNTLTEEFLKDQKAIAVAELDTNIASLEQDLSALQARGSTTAEQVAAIRTRISDLQLQRANPTDLRLAEAAQVPDGPSSPRPVRNTLLAIFLALFIGILVALGRAQLRPSVSDPRELGRMLGLPVLAGIPYVRRRGRRKRQITAVEHESYETLSASLRFTLGDGDGQKVLIVSSAVHGEGKTTVTSRLGQALARSGLRVLLVSADMRWPTMHEIFGLRLKPGLSDILTFADAHDGKVGEYVLPAIAHSVAGSSRPGSGVGELHVITGGSKPAEPSTLLTGGALGSFVEHARTFDYDYILLDAPPMLGIADVQALARYADEMLVVGRLDRLTMDNVIDTRELLDRLDVKPFGLVVIGARTEGSPYYMGERRKLDHPSEASSSFD